MKKLILSMLLLSGVATQANEVNAPEDKDVPTEINWSIQEIKKTIKNNPKISIVCAYLTGCLTAKVFENEIIEHFYRCLLKSMKTDSQVKEVALLLYSCILITTFALFRPDRMAAII